MTSFRRGHRALHKTLSTPEKNFLKLKPRWPDDLFVEFHNSRPRVDALASVGFFIRVLTVALTVRL